MQINDRVLANWRERQANVHNFLMTKLVLLCRLTCTLASMHIYICILSTKRTPMKH